MEILIKGRRWFQKSYGNTYHTAQIFIDGELVHDTPQTYGYEQQYLETALRWLDKSGLVEPRERHANGGYEGNRQWAERQGHTLRYEAQDASRERDL